MLIIAKIIGGYLGMYNFFKWFFLGVQVGIFFEIQNKFRHDRQM
jgi:hypothetical protein